MSLKACGAPMEQVQDTLEKLFCAVDEELIPGHRNFVFQFMKLRRKKLSIINDSLGHSYHTYTVHTDHQ